MAKVVAITNNKKARAKKTPLASTVKKLVKSEINKNVETKVFRSTDAAYVVDRLTKCQNLLYPVSVGTGDGDYIGDKIRLKGISMQLHIEHNNSIDAVRQYRMALVRSKKQYSTTGLATITSGEIFNTNGAAVDMHGITPFDTNNIDVLWSKLLVSKPRYSGASDRDIIKFYKKFDEPFQFTQTNSGLGKRHQYYFIIFAENDVSAGLSNVAWFTYNWQIYYKDA